MCYAAGAKRRSSDNVGNRQITRLIAHTVAKAVSKAPPKDGNDADRVPFSINNGSENDQLLSSSSDLTLQVEGEAAIIESSTDQSVCIGQAPISLDRADEALVNSDSVFHYQEVDLSYDDYLVICDTCNVCAHCVCFLSCGTKHEPICNHCEKCTKAVLKLGDPASDCDEVADPDGLENYIDNAEGPCTAPPPPTLRSELADWGVDIPYDPPALSLIWLENGSLPPPPKLSTLWVLYLYLVVLRIFY